MAAAIEPSFRKRVLKVIFISLLLDLISFTFILPLFPKLIEFYRDLEASSPNQNTLLAWVLRTLNTYKNSFSRPIDSKYDIVLLGGALGSLFSALQAIASPIIGILSDKYGRRNALLVSLAGNILSVLCWVMATDFRTFLMSRIIGGISEGNVQLAISMATDISDEKQRGSTMALVGACFCIAFTFGPALGAYLSTVATVAANPFAAAAGFSLLLIVIETIYVYLALPETLPSLSASSKTSGPAVTDTLATPSASTRAKAKANGTSIAAVQKGVSSGVHQRTNSHFILNLTHFAFILFFSGMEFSLPFMMNDLFNYSAAMNGRILGYMGLIASILQGGVTRRLSPLVCVKLGVVSCLASFFMLARLTTVRELYIAASLLAVTTATVVTGLNSLSSFEAGENERGEKLGALRSWGQIGRATGPLAFCTLYWWAGRDVAYTVGGMGMLAVAGLVFTGLKTPKGLIGKKVKDVKVDSKDEL